MFIPNDMASTYLKHNGWGLGKIQTDIHVGDYCVITMQLQMHVIVNDNYLNDILVFLRIK